MDVRGREYDPKGPVPGTREAIWVNRGGMYDRRVYLGERGKAEPGHCRNFLTPNENAARTLGVEPLSLETLARDILGEERVAHPVTAQRLLRAAAEGVLGSADPDGVARTLLPPIRELFRSGADLDANSASLRARRVVQVARDYRERLRGQGLVDPAETLWEAARSSPRPSGPEDRAAGFGALQPGLARDDRDALRVRGTIRRR